MVHSEERYRIWSNVGRDRLLGNFGSVHLLVGPITVLLSHDASSLGGDDGRPLCTSSLLRKPRVPISQASSVRRFNLDFVVSRKFLFLELGNILEGLGYFVPSIYLPTYAQSLGLSSAATAATVAVLNGAAVFGCIFIGILVDRYHVTTILLISSIGAVVSVLVFWGLATSVPLLLIFSAAYGFFAGSYSSCWTGVIKEVKKDHSAANMGIIFSFLAAGRGIGSIACGPLSEALLKNGAWKGEAALGYGTGYGGLIVYTGVTALLGGLTFGARRLGVF